MKTFPFNNRFFPFVLLCLFAIRAAAIPPEIPTGNGTIFSSFYSEDCIDITLESDFKKFKENKKKNLYQVALLSYTTKEGVKTNREVLIKARGKSRRNICDMPPIMLKCSKNELISEGFSSGDNKLKIVTHCMERSPREAQQALLKEYLSYKMLNILTEKSFRVQLVTITYINSINHDEFEHFGFIIEGKKELARRLGGKTIKKRDIPVSDLESSQYNTVALFQYMIGNTDWKLPLLHNLKAVSSGDTSNLTIVPYDFDYAGLVNAKYAALIPDHKQNDLRERVFLGSFASKAEMEETLNLFKSKEEEILLYCQNFSYLNKYIRRDVTKYIKSFYKDLGRSDRFLRRTFLSDI